MSTNNPLLMGHGLPPFNEIQVAHVVPAIEQILATVNTQLTALEQNITPTWAGLIEPVDRLSEQLNWAWGIVGHLMGVQNSPELRTAYETSQPQVIKFSQRLGQSQALYQGLKQIRDGAEWAKISVAQQRIIAAGIRDAEMSGVGLAGKKADRFNAIQLELAELTTKFSNNVLDATKAFNLDLTDLKDVAGLPPSLLAQAAQASRAGGQEQATPEAGPWRITLDAPSYVPFMQHSQQRHLRELVYKTLVSRAAGGERDNAGHIERILTLRQEEAELLGFESYAEMSLASKMAPNVAAVEDLLESLRQVSFDVAKQELADLSEFSHIPNLQVWDIAYWSERLREQKYDFNAEELRPYFPLEQVLTGLFNLANQLFGISIVPADGQADVWNKDVRYFQVNNEENKAITSGASKAIAYFFLDPYSRPAEKRGGAWMNDCVSRQKLANEVRLPVAYLVCNQSPPVDGKPSLMTFSEVETLFHEFGHGLQHMLTTVDYVGASGINNVEWDAVELPSQFMENWCYHRPTLLSMGKHYQTGEPLPDHYYQKLVAAKNFMSGSAMLRQIHFSWVDIELHHRYQPGSGSSANAVRLELAKKTTVLPPIPEDQFLCAFGHIFAGGYAAGYYSYKWAEVLSADAFAAFEDAGLDDVKVVQQTGRRFRDTVLALGGSQPPLEVFKSFRGREPQADALLRHSGLLATV
jgi:oligopeptidase A